jgi:hypothetical protein
MHRFFLLACSILVSTVLAGVAAGQLSETFVDWAAHPAIAYATQPTTDPVAELSRRVQEGKSELKSDGPSGYLRSVLDALNVPIESQVVVFVKDSVQAIRINIGNPRSLFFNESVAVGWVRGGFIELASQDPTQGVIFYRLDRTFTGGPRFTRDDSCLSCHHAFPTMAVPGMLARSVGQFQVDDHVPLDRRWGGWYVTGTHGSIQHMGNAEPARLFESPRPTDTFNWPSLDGKLDMAGYLSPHSDIVALMVFEHQMHLMNLLTRIGWDARVADYEWQRGNAQRPGSPQGQADTIVPVADAAREVVDYLLFIDEAPLTAAIHGSTRFAEKFAAQGPRDRLGRSLRDLDLRRRLMRYPCSYLIYSPLFDKLPAHAKDAIYRRMWQVLSGKDRAARYTRLSSADRQAITEILRDTKKDLPDYFRSSV